MYALVKLTARTLGFVVSFTALSAAVCTVSEHFGKEPMKLTYVISDMIDSGLSLLPDKMEAGAKNMLTALDMAVSNVAKNIIIRLDP